MYYYMRCWSLQFTIQVPVMKNIAQVSWPIPFSARRLYSTHTHTHTHTHSLTLSISLCLSVSLSLSPSLLYTQWACGITCEDPSLNWLWPSQGHLNAVNFMQISCSKEMKCPYSGNAGGGDRSPFPRIFPLKIRSARGFQLYLDREISISWKTLPTKSTRMRCWLNK